MSPEVRYLPADRVVQKQFSFEITLVPNTSPRPLARPLPAAGEEARRVGLLLCKCRSLNNFALAHAFHFWSVHYRRDACHGLSKPTRYVPGQDRRCGAGGRTCRAATSSRVQRL